MGIIGGGACVPVSHPQHHPRIRLEGFDYSAADHAYSVTVCTHKRRAVFAEARFALEVCGSLRWLRSERGIAIFAYCLMPDHLHLVLRLPPTAASLGDEIRRMKSFTTRQPHEAGFSGPLGQPRFHDRIIRKHEDMADLATYILANPVRKGIVDDPAEYPYSGVLDPW